MIIKIYWSRWLSKKIAAKTSSGATIAKPTLLSDNYAATNKHKACHNGPQRQIFGAPNFPPFSESWVLYLSFVLKWIEAGYFHQVSNLCPVHLLILYGCNVGQNPVLSISKIGKIRKKGSKSELTPWYLVNFPFLIKCFGIKRCRWAGHKSPILTLLMTFTRPFRVCFELVLAKSSRVKLWCNE